MSDISEDRPDDPSLEQLLTRIERHAVRFDPATPGALRACGDALIGAGSPGLAADHMALLNLTNGLIWNGIQLYGTDPIPRPQRRYTLPSLVDATAEAHRHIDTSQSVLIGRTEDEWLVMTQGPGRIIYQEIDCIDGDIYRQAASVRRLLTRLIKERSPNLNA